MSQISNELTKMNQLMRSESPILSNEALATQGKSQAENVQGKSQAARG